MSDMSMYPAFDPPDDVVTVDDGTGFDTNANLPGDTGGETNGYYAGVTENNLGLDSYDYFSTTPGSRTDWLSGLNEMVSQVGNVARNVKQQQQSLRGPQRPTLSQQWKALSPFEQIGFLAVVVGLLFGAFKR